MMDAIFALWTITAMTLASYAPHARADEGDIHNESLRQALKDAVTVHRSPSGAHTLAAHCRAASGGCEARLDRYASLFAHEAHEAGTDPWLLVAMAYRESSLNPNAVGERGEFGILQLHPKSRWGALIRSACKQDPKGCTERVVRTAARLMARYTAQCGSVPRALGAYNTGRCQETSYARRVLAVHASLRRGRPQR